MIHQYFKAISAIPRGSQNESAIADYLVDFAIKKGFKFNRDKFHNVIIYKPGSVFADPVILQAHTDMVCEKEADSLHDFASDGIEIMIENGFYIANKTTLGADDGVGVAYMLAILDDQTLVHPPLECVFTVQEEIGLIGANLLDTSCLKSTRMIGLDASMEHVTTVSSSGGCRGELSMAMPVKTSYPNQLTVKIQDLSGGHSGESIHLEKANAIELAAKVLAKLSNSGLSAMRGGDKLNAIAIGCQFTIGTFLDQTTCEQLTQDCLLEIQEIYPHEKTMTITSQWQPQTTLAGDSQDLVKLSQMICLFPYGVSHRSLEIADLTLASANLGTIELKDDRITIGCSLRSPSLAMINELKQKIAIICQLTDFDVRYYAQYPGWQYVANSPLRTQLFETYQAIYGQKMAMEAVHGGLELGIFADKIKDLDIIAIGPIMYDIHTPRERLEIASFDRVYNLLIALLKNLVQPEGVQ